MSPLDCIYQLWWVILGNGWPKETLIAAFLRIEFLHFPEAVNVPEISCGEQPFCIQLGMDQNLLHTPFFRGMIDLTVHQVTRALIHSLSVEPTSGPDMDSLEASALYDLADHMVLQRHRRLLTQPVCA